MSLFADLVADYGDPLAEARQCRQSAALFDFSFVHRVVISGAYATDVLQRFQPRPIADMSIRDIRYSIRCNEAGAVRSDLTIWRTAPDKFELMSGHTADVSDLLRLRSAEVDVVDVSADTAILAIQDPRVYEIVNNVCAGTSLQNLRYFQFVGGIVAGVPCRLGRLGYTGEKGLELIVDRADKARLWNELSKSAAPAGFKAINILRLEAGFILFTNECRIAPRPSELGLQSIVSTRDSKARMRLVAFTGHPVSDEQLSASVLPHPELPGSGEISITSAC